MDLPLKPYRKEYAHSYTFGVFPTVELMERRPQAAVKVLLSESGLKNSGVPRLQELCERRRVPVEMNGKAVARLAPKENTFAVGVFRKYECDLDAGADHLLLVNPSDMGNLGTIMRTMLGFGVQQLALIRPAADIFDPRAVRASMGALFGLNFRYFDTFETYTGAYPPASRHLYAFMTGGHLSPRQARFKRPFTLIFGNESAGLPEAYREAGTTVTIAHTDEIDSLNLTIAVGIGLYEASRSEPGVSI